MNTFDENTKSSYFNKKIFNGVNADSMFMIFVKELLDKLFDNVNNKQQYIDRILGELQSFFVKFQKKKKDDIELLDFIKITPEMKKALDDNSNALAIITKDLESYPPQVQNKWTEYLSNIASLQFKLIVKNLRALKKSRQIAEQAEKVKEKEKEIEGLNETIKNQNADFIQKQKDATEKFEADKKILEQSNTTDKATALAELAATHAAALVKMKTDHEQQIQESTDKIQVKTAQLQQDQQQASTALKEGTETFVGKMLDALNQQASALGKLYDANVDESNADYYKQKHSFTNKSSLGNLPVNSSGLKHVEENDVNKTGKNIAARQTAATAAAAAAAKKSEEYEQRMKAASNVSTVSVPGIQSAQAAFTNTTTESPQASVALVPAASPAAAGNTVPAASPAAAGNTVPAAAPVADPTIEALLNLDETVISGLTKEQILTYAIALTDAAKIPNSKIKANLIKKAIEKANKAKTSNKNSDLGLARVALINALSLNPAKKSKYLKLSDDNSWEAKYLKYKQKYLALKNKYFN